MTVQWGSFNFIPLDDERIQISGIFINVIVMVALSDLINT